jgi:hypothetical protein
MGRRPRRLLARHDASLAGNGYPLLRRVYRLGDLGCVGDVVDLGPRLEGLARRPDIAHDIFFDHRHKQASPEFHKEIIDKLWGPHPMVAALCFRGAAKSTLAEEDIILEALFERFQYAVILCSNERLAADRLLSIKYELSTNKVIANVFGPQGFAVDQSMRVILANGRCIDAIGAGSSIRGMKYLNDKPNYAFIDDLEEMTKDHDNVSSPDKRDELSKWFFGSFLPAMQQPAHRVRMAGTMLHEESLIAKFARSPSWEKVVVPIEHFNEAGQKVSAWPDKFGPAKVEEIRKLYAEDHQEELFEREYMCRAAATEARAFRQDMFRFENRNRTWEPVWIVYDPARTVGPKSCATGKITASWIGGRLLIWEASRNFWEPDEIVNDIFASDDLYNPIAIGVEKTGLDQFILQPLRSAAARRGKAVPIRGLDPPRGPGKERFIMSLQPYFANGEVTFCGEPESFRDLTEELLGISVRATGLKDIANALAYMTIIKPGLPIYDQFRSENICDDLDVQRDKKFLIVHSDAASTYAALVAVSATSRVAVVADWLENGDCGHTLAGIVANARLIAADKILAYAPPEHFGKYDAIGLRPAASGCGLRVGRGGEFVQGREELRRRITLVRGESPLLLVMPDASWALRALSGGYAREPGKSEPMPGAYRVVGEALESFAAILAMGLDDEQDVRYAVDRNGRKYMTSAGAKQ